MGGGGGGGGVSLVYCSISQYICSSSKFPGRAITGDGEGEGGLSLIYPSILIL